MVSYGEPNIDPARDWDLYCDRLERQYKARIAGATCGDCGKCVVPGDEWENAERMGFCEEIGDFVSLDESVEDLECDDFEFYLARFIFGW